MLDFDKHWDYNDPQGTEVTFRELLATMDEEEHGENYLALQTQIARTLGLQQKFKEAHALLDSIEPRLAEEPSIPHIRYLLERGRCYNSAGEQDLARPLFHKAWEMGLGAKADFHAVDAAHMLAIVEPLERQLEWNERALELAESSLDPRAQGWLGSLTNNIAWTYHDQGAFDKALQLFEKGLVWHEGRKHVREAQIAKWCIARTHRSLGNIDLALALQLSLEQEIRASGGDQDGYVSEEIGECLTLQGKPLEAAPFFLQAWETLSQDPWLQANEAERLARLESLGKSEPSR